MVETAYKKDFAFDYDKIRFVSPPGRVFNQIECDELERRLRVVGKIASAVEVGCGTGRFLPLAAQYSDRVVGIDPSADMLAMTREKVQEITSVELIEGEGGRIPLADEAMDFVFSIRTLNQVGTKEYAHTMIHELFRVCKPGGYVLMEVVNHKSLNRATKDVRFTIREVCDFVGTHQLGTVQDTSGILFFSQTVLDKTPTPLLPLFKVVDKVFSTLFKHFCTRCYIFVRK